jgi:GPH family glycoside/pentoside/hexuronide:cation symporter
MLIGYFVAPMCAMLANSIFGSYLSRYYSDVLGWTKFGAFSALLPIVSVIFVIVGNLLIGQWIDKTRTSAGKARPYLLLSIPLLAAAIILMFMTPTGGSNIVQMGFIAVTYNLYYAIAYPCYYTAHSSMVSLSTRNSNQRGLLATLSNAGMVAAAGVGASIVVPILLQPFMFVTDDSGVIDIAASYGNWRIISSVMALVTAAGVFLEYLYTRERITEETADLNIQAEAIPTSKHIEVCTKEPYWWMVIIFILVGIAHIIDVNVIATGSVLRTAVIFFYLSNEGVSLLENAGHLGLPIPEKLKIVLEQLHDRSEKSDE